MELTFSVNNQTLTRTDSIGIIGETVGQFTASFTFNDWWDDCDKTAQFSKLGKVYEILLTDDSCVIPWEVLTGGVFYVTVYATQGAQKIKTTNEVAVSVTSSGLNKDGFFSPTPEMYAQILTELAKRVEPVAITGYIEEVPKGVYALNGAAIQVTNDRGTPLYPLKLKDGILAVMPGKVSSRLCQWLFIGGYSEKNAEHFTNINILYGTVSNTIPVERVCEFGLDFS